jgi:HK97 family phage major capsid protein
MRSNLAGLPGALGLPRAIRAIRGDGSQDPAAVIRDLTAAFADFRRKHEAEQDSLNAQIAALRFNGTPGRQAAGASREARAALGAYIKTGSMAETAALPRSQMTIGSDPDGGYFVPDELSTELISIARNAVAMRGLAAVRTITGASLKQPINLHGMGSGWVGETQDRPAQVAPKLALIEFTPREVYANPAVSQSLLDDSAINLADFLTGEISDEFAIQEGTAFLNGTGVTMPRGLLTYDIVAAADADRPFGRFQYVPGGDPFVAAGADALKTLVFTLKAKYRLGASWMMNSLTASVVATFKDGEGRYLWVPALNATPGTLLGYPVVIDEGMPDVASNAFPIAFGDFKRGYMIVDREGVRILRDPLTNKPNVLFYATKRVDGQALDSNAIKFLKVAAD